MTTAMMIRSTMALAAIAMAGAGCQTILGIEDVGLRDAGAVPDANEVGIVTTILVAPPPLTNETNAVFGFTATVGFSGFECRLGEDEFEPCQSPHQIVVGEGDLQFQVRALDEMNLPGQAAPYDWTVDLTGPEAMITSIVPTGSIVTFNFGLAIPEEDATLECSLNGSEFEACVSGFSQTLGDGSFVFRVRGRDALGNVGAPPAEGTFILSTGSPPETTITLGPTNPSNDTTPTFEFNSSLAGSTFECSVDNGPFQLCASGDALLTLSDGPHTFAVAAIDATFGTDMSPDTHSWMIDTVPPITTFTNGPPNPAISRSANISYSSEAGATFACSFDQGPFTSPCPSPYNVNLLSTAGHNLRVRTTDLAGNVAAPAVFQWDVAIVAFATAPIDGALGTSFSAGTLDGGVAALSARERADALCSDARPSAVSTLPVRAVLCVDMADSVASMPGNYSIPSTSPVVGRTGPTLGLTWAGFAGGATLLNKLEDAGIVVSNSEVWMGCAANGATLPEANCSNWGAGTQFIMDVSVGTVAITNTINSGWLRSSARTPSCSEEIPLLCVAY